MREWCLWVLAACISASVGILSGCSREMGSFEISSAHHALTLVVIHPYLWSQHYEVSLVIANLPECQREYPLFDEPGAHWQASLYLESKTEMILQVNQHFYLLDHARCHIAPIESLSGKDFAHYADTAKIGQFVSIGHGRLRFVLDRKMAAVSS